MTPTCAAPIPLADALDYWAGDLEPDAAERIEEHIFTCEACAAQIAEVAALGRTIAALVRTGNFHATVTDAVLNQLAKDGLRIRTYSVRPGQIVPCAVWSDDDLIVSRLQVDLRGVQALAAVAYGPDGQVLGRLPDVPIRDGQTEVIDAISASLIRQVPAGEVRFALVEPRPEGDRVLGEYTFAHEGALDR